MAGAGFRPVTDIWYAGDSPIGAQEGATLLFGILNSAPLIAEQSCSGREEEASQIAMAYRYDIEVRPY